MSVDKIFVLVSRAHKCHLIGASGTGYGVRASPSLAGLFKLASDKVDDPLVAGRSLLSNLAAEIRDHATLEEGFVGQAIGKNGDLKIAPLGSGSGKPVRTVFPR